jgi:hypothetical protein
MPDWDAPLDSVNGEPFGRSFFTRGLLLRTPDKPPAIFWCSRRTQKLALNALRVRS